MKPFRPLQILAGIIFGSGLTYFFDSHRGRARRALFKDQVSHFYHQADLYFFRFRRGVFYRTKGFVAELQSRIAQLSSKEESVLDDVLIARIRSKIGRVASHPHFIEVHSHSGDVILKGQSLPYETQEIFDAVRTVPGVKKVHCQLVSSRKAA